jgi:hypothetical protein
MLPTKPFISSGTGGRSPAGALPTMTAPTTTNPAPLIRRNTGGSFHGLNS